MHSTSVQIVSCAKCRYKYELISGDIVSIESEEIRFVPSGFVYLFSILLLWLFFFVIIIAFFIRHINITQFVLYSIG